MGWAYIYYAGAGRLQEGRRMIDEALARNPEDSFALRARALVLAMEGRRAEALAMLPMLPRQSTASPYHHSTYLQACVYAVAGDAEAAVDWLDVTVKHGLPVYPAFGRDRCFDPIRSSASFTRFMANLKPVWEDYERRLR